MAKNKETKKATLKSGKEIVYEVEFFLNDLVKAIENSECIYSSIAHKAIVVSTITMLFHKLKLTDYMNNIEVKIEDYKEWFEQPAIENGIDNFIYTELFGDKDEK